MKRSKLLSSLFRKVGLPAGQTVAEAKQDADAAWKERRAYIVRENFFRHTGRHLDVTRDEI